MKTPITGPAFIQALQDAGILNPDDRIRRVVIDARHTHVVVMHIELAGDQGLLTVVPSLEGVKVQREYRPPTVGTADPGNASYRRLRDEGRCAILIMPKAPSEAFVCMQPADHERFGHPHSPEA